MTHVDLAKETEQNDLTEPGVEPRKSGEGQAIEWIVFWIDSILFIPFA